MLLRRRTKRDHLAVEKDPICLLKLARQSAEQVPQYVLFFSTAQRSPKRWDGKKDDPLLFASPPLSPSVRMKKRRKEFVDLRRRCPHRGDVGMGNKSCSRVKSGVKERIASSGGESLASVRRQINTAGGREGGISHRGRRQTMTRERVSASRKFLLIKGLRGNK